MQARNAYIETMKKHLDELDIQMSELEFSAAKLKGEAKANYQHEIAKVHQQSVLAKASFEELKTSSEASWKSVVLQTEKLRDAFVNSFAYFKSQI